MKFLTFFLLLIATTTGYGQIGTMAAPGGETGQINTMLFDYDIVGNQTRRYYLYIASSGKRVNPAEEFAPIETIPLVEYFPNPVKGQLSLRWTEIEDNDLQFISVYGINGVQLKKLNVDGSENFSTIDFEQFPSGIYNLDFTYADGSRKSVKIIKD